MRFPLIQAPAGVFLAFGAAILLSGCHLRSDADEGEESTSVDAADERVFIGNITLVNHRSNFVLIKTPVNQQFQKGYPFESFTDGQKSADLLFSPEQSYGFMTADISRGAPLVGDQVYLLYSEGFGDGMSDRMRHATEKHKREQEMGFFERRKYEREQRRQARKKKRSE